MAVPLILANAAVPLLGITDTTVIGRVGTTHELGAIALGSLIFNFVFWTFGFLRMGTTGFVAQAKGARDDEALVTALARGLALALCLGLALIALEGPIAALSLRLLGASEASEAHTRAYIALRIWGAPASLSLFVVFGTLIGLGETRRLLLLQLGLNGLNAALDVLLAGSLGLGVRGIALGTVLSEWLAYGAGLWLTLRALGAHTKARFSLPKGWLDPRGLVRVLRSHGDILLRTFFLLLGFGWLTRLGAGFGDTTLAANHLLLQLVSFCAFFLDGYAFVAEAFVGEAVGAKRLDVFDRAVRRTTILALGTTLCLALALLFAGATLVRFMTDIASVRDAAITYLPYAALYVAVAVLAFQLDGVFIGATRTRALRNAAFVSSAFFLATSTFASARFGNHGAWAAFIGYALVRALTLAIAYPALRRALAADAAHRHEPTRT